MPWCPKCKMEYREEITECIDCNIPLVEELEKEVELEVLAMTEEEGLATKLVDFLKYSNVDSATTTFNEEDNTWSVLVEKSSIKSAKKLYQAFCIAELEQEENKKSNKLTKEQNNEEDLDINTENLDLDTDNESICEEEMAKDLQEKTEELRGAKATSYVKKEDQYKDLKSTAFTFLIFGVLGLVVVILNAVGILSFFAGWVPNIVLTLLFLGFLYIGITTYTKANKTKGEIGEELDQTKQVNEWLSENMTASLLSELHDEHLSEEANYIHKTEHIKKMLIKALGEMDDAYLDQAIEDFYNDHFEE